MGGGSSFTASSTCMSRSPNPRTYETIADHSGDLELGAEQLPDICNQLHRVEGSVSQPSYMDRQPEVNSEMRAILVGWLYDVTSKKELRLETLFLAVSLVDRFLEKRTTKRRDFQLIGVAALMIAAKFEHSKPPTVKEFVDMSGKAYSKEEILRMEVRILTAVEFNIFQPTAVHFLQCYQRMIWPGEAHGDLAQTMLRLALAEYDMQQHTPSHLAAAALLASHTVQHRQPPWTLSAVKHTQKTELMLKACAKEICGLLEKMGRNGWRQQLRSAEEGEREAPDAIDVPTTPPPLLPVKSTALIVRSSTSKEIVRKRTSRH